MKWGEEIQARKDEILRTNDTTKRIVYAEGQIQELLGSIERDQDPDTAEAVFADGISKIKESALDGIDDQAVMNSMTKHLAQREFTETAGVKHKTLTWTVQRGQADVLERLDEYAKIAASGDEFTFKQYFDLGEETIAKAGADGLYSADKVVELRKKMQKTFFAQRYNRMIEQDPEEAIKNFGWLKQIDDPKMEMELLNKAVTWANKIQSQEDKAFKDKSGAALNRLMIDVNMGRYSRQQINEMIGKGDFTDEHERILLHEFARWEESTTKRIKSNPERFGFWKEEIEYASLRGDDDALKKYAEDIRNDHLIAGEDRAYLFATLATKQSQNNTQSSDFKAGYTQAIDVADAYCEYNSFERKYGSPKKKAVHNDMIRKIQDMSAGKKRDPKTGKIIVFPPLKGWELVEYARQLVEDDRKKREQERAAARQAEAQDKSRIPPAPEQKR